MEQNVMTHTLKETVETRLRQHSRLKDYPIEVLDHNGMIVLQGRVPSEAISMIAEEFVRQIDGVFSVSNELYVRKV